MIDGQALVVEAQRTGLRQGPGGAAPDGGGRPIRRWRRRCCDKVIGPTVTDEPRCAPAIDARHRRQAGRGGGACPPHPGGQTRPRPSRSSRELKKGADFAALVQAVQQGPRRGDQGGDLGFFKKDEMVPEFADAAFAMQPGQIYRHAGAYAVRLARDPGAGAADRPPRRPSSRPASELRQKMIQEGVQQAVADARAKVTVEKFNLDGSPLRATDTAEPPPAPSPDAGAPTRTPTFASIAPASTGPGNIQGKHPRETPKGNTGGMPGETPRDTPCPQRSRRLPLRLPELPPLAGVRLGAAAAGIRYQGRDGPGDDGGAAGQRRWRACSPPTNARARRWTGAAAR